MDIALAQTFLMVAETGSFIDAARKLNVTQSTVSARIRGLEELFGRPLFERSKNGASLTGAGEQFQKHALALVRVWQHAQLEVGFSGPAPRPSGGRRARNAVGRLPDALDLLAARQHPRHRHLGLRQPVGRDDPAPPGRHARSRRHVPPRTAAGPHHRASVRRGVRAGHQRSGAQPAHGERLRVRRLGPRLPGRSCGRLPRADQHGVNLDLARWGSTTCSPTRPRATSRSGSSSATSTGAACAFRRGRAPSARPSTWSTRRRATRRPTSRSCRACGVPPSG